MHVFNSLTACLQPFTLRDEKKIRWYTCGPTVYDSAHLGHARNYVAQDIIRRIFEYLGYDVKMVMNITDIDDKIIVRSQELRVSPTDLTRRYEKEFLRDMDRLNVSRPSILTRVSEYIPEIVTYISAIMDRKFAYEINGSVYFDLTAYTREFKYGLLHPFDESTLIDDTMSGRLKDKNDDKHSQMDFALWKASKDGEPSWKSPWGSGRPGWHIECSVMANCVLGPTFDLHSGGEDLRFPHHENELAQGTAHNNADDCVTYFIHTGHLHIEGCKMSKSLKNFITIETALETYTPRQLRILFLLHHYRATLNYSDHAMETAVNMENVFNEFLSQTRALIDKSDVAKWTERDCEVENKFEIIKVAIDQSLRNDFDTPRVLELIGDLIKTIYIYMNSDPLNVYLIRSIRAYIVKMLTTFGLDFDTVKSQSDLLPAVLDAMTGFRDRLRKIIKDPKFNDIKSLRQEIFKLSDQYRDNTLPSIGIAIDDKPDGTSIWKIK